MKTKKNLFVILALIVGYALGILISFPNFDSGLLSSDIGKVTKFNKSSKTEVTALQERLENDSIFRKNTLTSLVLANYQISMFKRLTEVTDSIAGNIASLKSCVHPILAMKEFTCAAKTNADTTLVAFSALLKGEGVESGYDYESLSQKMMISSVALDKQYDAARTIVSEIDSYIKQNKEKVEGLQELRDEWVLFCAYEAALNGRKYEMEYWKQQSLVSDNEDLLDFIFPGLSGFPDNEDLLDIFPGLSGFPDNENLLNIFPGLSGFPDNENLLDIFPGLSGFPDNENLLNWFPHRDGIPDNERLTNN